jgi:hypothetical protein
MSFILFVMFLIAPPGKTDPDWTLQNTTTMEFANRQLCESAAKEILESIKKTATITMVAWCFDKEQPPPTPMGAGKGGRSVPPSSRLNLK